jgi:hypothetical protein
VERGITVYKINRGRYRFGRRQNNKCTGGSYGFIMSFWSRGSIVLASIVNLRAYCSVAEYSVGFACPSSIARIV